MISGEFLMAKMLWLFPLRVVYAFLLLNFTSSSLWASFQRSRISPELENPLLHSRFGHDDFFNQDRFDDFDLTPVRRAHEVIPPGTNIQA
jgi:hypothetical protein